jgi:hypothetical protein
VAGRRQKVYELSRDIKFGGLVDHVRSYSLLKKKRLHVLALMFVCLLCSS